MYICLLRVILSIYVPIGFKSKGRVLLLGDFNARVSKPSDLQDVVGMLGKILVTAMNN